MKYAESLVGPYVWEKYDLLILPPSFPYGGMENPCLTFVTPTVLVSNCVYISRGFCIHVYNVVLCTPGVDSVL